MWDEESDNFNLDPELESLKRENTSNPEIFKQEIRYFAKLEDLFAQRMREKVKLSNQFKVPTGDGSTLEYDFLWAGTGGASIDERLPITLQIKNSELMLNSRMDGISFNNNPLAQDEDLSEVDNTKQIYDRQFPKLTGIGTQNFIHVDKDDPDSYGTYYLVDQTGKSIKIEEEPIGFEDDYVPAEDILGFGHINVELNLSTGESKTGKCLYRKKPITLGEIEFLGAIHMVIAKELEVDVPSPDKILFS